MKVIYVNKKTGEEVHYGDSVTFIEEGTYGKGYKWHSDTTLPVCNETIPMLIEKGIVVQKEVKEGTSVTLEDRLDTLQRSVDTLFDEIQDLKEFFVQDLSDDEGE